MATFQSAFGGGWETKNRRSSTTRSVFNNQIGTMSSGNTGFGGSAGKYGVLGGMLAGGDTGIPEFKPAARALPPRGGNAGSGFGTTPVVEPTFGTTPVVEPTPPRGGNAGSGFGTTPVVEPTPPVEPPAPVTYQPYGVATPEQAAATAAAQSAQDQWEAQDEANRLAMQQQLNQQFLITQKANLMAQLASVSPYQLSDQEKAAIQNAYDAEGVETAQILVNQYINDKAGYFSSSQRAVLQSAAPQYRAALEAQYRQQNIEAAKNIATDLGGTDSADEVKAKWNALSPEAKAMYQKYYALYRDSFSQTQQIALLQAGVYSPRNDMERAVVQNYNAAHAASATADTDGIASDYAEVIAQVSALKDKELQSIRTQIARDIDAMKRKLASTGGYGYQGAVAGAMQATDIAGSEQISDAMSTVVKEHMNNVAELLLQRATAITDYKKWKADYDLNREQIYAQNMIDPSTGKQYVDPATGMPVSVAQYLSQIEYYNTQSASLKQQAMKDGLIDENGKVIKWRYNRATDSLERDDVNGEIYSVAQREMEYARDRQNAGYSLMNNILSQLSSANTEVALMTAGSLLQSVMDSYGITLDGKSYAEVLMPYAFEIYRNNLIESSKGTMSIADIRAGVEERIRNAMKAKGITDEAQIKKIMDSLFTSTFDEDTQLLINSYKEEHPTVTNSSLQNGSTYTYNSYGTVFGPDGTQYHFDTNNPDVILDSNNNVVGYVQSRGTGTIVFTTVPPT